MAAIRNSCKFINLYKNQLCCSVINFSSASSSSNSPSNPITHTGQQWDEKDYRMVRFIDKEKKVNKQWAVKLIAEVPPEHTKSRVVWCDGGGGPTGHPKVYINLDKPGNHSCGYCGLRFEMDTHH